MKTPIDIQLELEDSPYTHTGEYISRLQKALETLVERYVFDDVDDEDGKLRDKYIHRLIAKS